MAAGSRACQARPVRGIPRQGARRNPAWARPSLLALLVLTMPIIPARYQFKDRL